MPIAKKPMEYVDGSFRAGQPVTEHVGEVAAVRSYTAQRNCSDTLDYSDYQQVTVTEALVYRGRTWRGKFGFDREESPCPVEERFHWVDCTCLFTWRGSPSLTPTADPRESWVPGMAEDFTLWQEAQERAARELANRKREQEELDRVQREGSGTQPRGPGQAHGRRLRPVAGPAGERRLGRRPTPASAVKNESDQG